MKKWSMMFLAGLFILAGAGFLVSWNRAAELRSEKKALQVQVENLKKTLADARALVRQASSPSPEDRARTSELMRLRNEVTQLRGAAENAARLEQVNARLTQDIADARGEIGQLRAARAAQAVPPPPQQVQQPQRAQATEPIEFYRRNPELMRRYFPHLAEEAGQEQPAPQGQQP